MAHRNGGPRQFIAAALAGSAASARFLGHNIAGDYGLQSASQPLPGLYLSALYFGYHADTLRDRDGNAVSIDPQ